MCFAIKQQLLYLSVPATERPTWTPIHFMGMVHFDLRIFAFRAALIRWMSPILNGRNRNEVPGTLWRMLYQTSYDDYFTTMTNHFKMSVFFSVLLFLYNNGAPVCLGQMWWALFFDEPVFDHLNRCGTGHPYWQFFLMCTKVTNEFFAIHGSFYDLKNGCIRFPPNQMFSLLWNAYNVWGCRGVYDDGVFPDNRLVDVVIRMVDRDGLEPVDWDLFGLISVETTTTQPERYQDAYRFVPCKEGGVVEVAKELLFFLR